jgi:hypothetical protein
MSDRSDAVLMQQIAAAIRGIEYGSVEIVIHDGRVVQVERREKFRPDTHAAPRID